jgi:transcriptional regulator with XRE-family HTH domain
VLKVGDVAEPKVGPIVRALRKELGRTLADVAAASGLSVPFLSQVENGRTSTSLRSLQALADALGTTAVALLTAAEEAARVDVVRAGENSLEDGATGAVRVLVRGHRQLHALEFTGATDRGDRTFQHTNDELIYVVRGSARVLAGDEEHLLAAGDTLYWAAGVSHSWRALTDDTQVLLVAVNEKARVNLEPPRS